ncbi:MAG: hypothetical protein GY953_37490, partial [bacterium]|nr:hypothetical protein [bacterium]
FVVVWQSDGSGGSDLSGPSIQAQRYASDGSTAGGELQVNTATTRSPDAPSMALGATGDWVVVWTSNGSGGTDSSYGSVQAQRYASDGFPAGGQFQVNAYTSGMQYGASMGLEADGDFVVIWHSEGSGGTDSLALSVQGQRYASDGSPAGSQFQVNTYTTNSQHYPTVALAADGDFVAMWHSLGSSGTDSSFQSIQRQRYASDGSVVGGEFQVNTYTSNRQEYASVAIDGTGNVVVVWDSEGSGGTDSSGRSIQKTLGGLIFADGFESGDTSSWSATVGGG